MDVKRELKVQSAFGPAMLHTNRIEIPNKWNSRVIDIYEGNITCYHWVEDNSLHPKGFDKSSCFLQRMCREIGVKRWEPERGVQGGS
jgi:hypothetical protein